MVIRPLWYGASCACSALLLLSACERPKPREVSRADEKGRWSVQPVVRNEELARHRWGRELRALLAAEAYDSLEALARDARDRKLRMPNGQWRLHVFYTDGLGSTDHEDNDEEMRTLIGHLEKWTEARPTSVTAHVALADAWREYAWLARGSGRASTVKQEQWDLMRERLQVSVQALRQARQVGPPCPGWYPVAMAVALVDGTSRADYDALFEEGRRLEPGYLPLYTYRANYLTARWHGRRGEMEQFVADAADHIGGDEGDALYAAIVRRVVDMYRGSLGQYDFDWPRVRRGFERLEASYPDSFELLNWYARLAVEAKDREVAAPLFQRLDLRYDPAVWGADGDAYIRARVWAMRD